MKQAASKQSALTPEYLLDGLEQQRVQIQAQIVQQSIGLSMFPAGLFQSMRRAQEVMIEDLMKEEADLERAIEVLEAGGAGCIEAAFAILTTPANMLGHINPPHLHDNRVLH